MEDIQFVLGVFSREEPLQVSEGHIDEYLANRYQPTVALMEGLAIQAAYNWLVKNWDELVDVGLWTRNENGAGFVNALLFSLHNLVFRTPKPSWWIQVPDIDSKELIREVQTFVDAAKRSPSNLEE